MNASPELLPDRVDGLVVIDVQNGFRTATTEHVIHRICGLTIAAGQSGLPIVLTQFTNPTRTLFRTELDWHLCSDQHPSAGFVAELRDIASHHPVVRKVGYAANGALAAHCRAHGVSRPLVVGIDTDSCVLGCAIELFDNGIAPVVAADACASTGGPEMHDAGIVLMQRMLGTDAVLWP